MYSSNAISLQYSNKNTIENNRLIWNSNGIYMFNSNFTAIIDNTLEKTIGDLNRVWY